MIYPLFSYEDGTEVTASKPDSNGNVTLYIERFDERIDSFINATIVIPNASIKSSYGYTQEELDNMLVKYSKMQYDIIEYIKNKSKWFKGIYVVLIK